MSALSNRKAQFVAPSATAAFTPASPWTSGDGVLSGARARELQAQLKADLFKGRLETHTKPAPYSPARGLIVAAVPSALLWWGIVSAISALVHHAH